MSPSFVRQRVAMTTVAATLSILLLLEITQAAEAATGCRGAEMCCRQKDNKCRVPGQRMNRKGHVHGVNQTCFCDAGCLELGDCCVDYRHYCEVVDCEVSNDWSDWGECSVLCGLGIKERHRRIIRHSQNGGKPCPVTDTVQRAICEGVTCKLPRAVSPAVLQQLRDIGRILPHSYARWRQSQRYNPYTGMRKHLFTESSPVDDYKSCATYEITSTRSPCLKSKPVGGWTTALKPGVEVCVECQTSMSAYSSPSSSTDNACQGRGVYNRETRWAAMTSPGCHGTWVMKTRWQRCSCPTSGKDVPQAFVFV